MGRVTAALLPLVNLYDTYKAQRFPPCVAVRQSGIMFVAWSDEAHDLAARSADKS